jgi:hypothetical protein
MVRNHRGYGANCGHDNAKRHRRLLAFDTSRDGFGLRVSVSGVKSFISIASAASSDVKPWAGIRPCRWLMLGVRFLRDGAAGRDGLDGIAFLLRRLSEVTPARSARGRGGHSLKLGHAAVADSGLGSRQLLCAPA